MHLYKIDIDKCPNTGLIVNKIECPKCVYHRGFKVDRGTPCVLCSWFLDDGVE